MENWKKSTKTSDAYKMLLRPISNDSDETPFDRILEKVWSTITPNNNQLAYTLTVCQIMLNHNFDKLVMDDVVTKKRLERNIVSNILLNIYLIYIF